MYLIYYIFAFFLFSFNIIYAKNVNISNIDKKLNKYNDDKDDKYYLIYVNNTYGEIKLFSDIKNQKRQESFVFLESLIDEINDIIINNKETYQNTTKLEEIEEISKLKKRNSETNNLFDSSDFVYPISSVDDRVVLLAYLSKELIHPIMSIDKVIDCEPESYFKHNASYNKKDILQDTQWKDVSIQEKATNHLSILSQGLYDPKLVDRYDNTYYYPESAGKNINIIVIDSDFNFDYSEFSNTNERVVKCVVRIERGKSYLCNNEKVCGKVSPRNHGKITSDLAGGLEFGTAKRANIYGISLDFDEDYCYSNSDILAALQYTYEKMIQPYKTVITMSITGYERTDSSSYKQYQSIINSITKKNSIFISPSGNDGENFDENPTIKKYIPCEIDNVICIGGVDNKNSTNLYEMYINSNYGSNVNFFGPYRTRAKYKSANNNNQVVTENQRGTSFSAPLIAGLIATIMSENTNIQFTKQSIQKKLSDISKNEIIKDRYGRTYLFANNGKHIVYSANNVYHGCGVYAGNRPCPSKTTPRKRIVRDDFRCGPEFDNAICLVKYCCSTYGYCGKSTEHCKTYCVSEFGECTPTIKTKIPTSTVIGRCGSDYGSCRRSNECCSKYNYCGTSNEYCGKGCQSDFGYCI